MRLPAQRLFSLSHRLTDAVVHDVLLLFLCWKLRLRGLFMNDISDGEPVRLVFHNDDDTPQDFVTELLRTVFGHVERDALAFTLLIDQRGKAACGPYPPSVASALLAAAQLRSGARLAAGAPADQN
jgi:ATP-dependent Clp protease adapter protein ClpS